MQYPVWFVLFCIAAGAVYAAVLYYNDTRIADKESPHRTKRLAGLSILRFLAVSFIAFLLLSPLVKKYFSETEKPIVVLLQDASESVGKEIDAAEYIRQVDKLTEDLQQNFEVHRYAFGSRTDRADTIKFNREATNISGALTEITNLYENQYLGAVILATDGIYNQGSDPVYATGGYVSVYTVALGDTSVKKDLLVRKVHHNAIAYLGDKFTVQVDITANNLAGKRSLLTIQKIEDSPKTVFQQAVQISKDNFEAKITALLDAEKTGVQHYRISLSAVEGEAVAENNQTDFFIDVLESRQRVLLAANAPHPDLAAIKQSIEANKNYEVELWLPESFSAALDRFSLVILHQLPSRQHPAEQIFKKVSDQKVPHLFILGAQTDIGRFNQVQNMLKIEGFNNNFDDARAAANVDFTAFKIDEQLQEAIKNLPPLRVPFGESKTAAGADIALFQKVGAVTTKKPLLLLHSALGERSGALAGEGLWRWRLYDFKNDRNHQSVNTLLNKIVQYLSVKEDKRQFRVLLQKKTFSRNEPVVLGAQMYNESFELTNEPEADIFITDEEGKKYDYTFQRADDNTYHLNAGFLPEGKYSFTASAVLNQKKYIFNGEFIVQEQNLEALQTQANHQLLYKLSQSTGGKMFYPAQMNELAADLMNKEEIKPVIYENYSARAMINIKGLFFILLTLLALEWGVRRWSGGY